MEEKYGYYSLKRYSYCTISRGLHFVEHPIYLNAGKVCWILSIFQRVNHPVLKIRLQSYITQS